MVTTTGQTSHLAPMNTTRSNQPGTSSSSSTINHVPPSTMPLVSPHALLTAHLQQTPPTRPSNRSPTDLRPIELNIGSLTHCNGSSVVKIGSSTVVCGVRAEILPVSSIPHYRIQNNNSGNNSAILMTAGGTGNEEDQEQEKHYEAVRYNNLLVPNLELGTGCHPSFPVNAAPSTTAQSVSQRILSLLHSSRLVRTSDLEIRYKPSAEELEAMNAGLDPDDPAYVAAPAQTEEGELKAYWVLYIDMMCISYDGAGAVFDTAWLAVMAALKDTLLPSAWWDRDEGKIFCSAETAEAKRLDLRGCLVPLSFAACAVPPTNQYDGVKHGQGRAVVLLDADLFEEEVCKETGTVTLDLSGAKQRMISRIEKSGGGVVGTSEVRELIIPGAERRWKEWQSALAKAVKSSIG